MGMSIRPRRRVWHASIGSRLDNLEGFHMVSAVRIDDNLLADCFFEAGNQTGLEKTIGKQIVIYPDSRYHMEAFEIIETAAN